MKKKKTFKHVGNMLMGTRCEFFKKWRKKKNQKKTQKKKKLFVNTKSAYYAFWAAVRLPKCSSMTSVVHGHIQLSLRVRSTNEEKKIMDRKNGWKKKSRWTETNG
jgi:hypothetical protein